MWGHPDLDLWPTKMKSSSGCLYQMWRNPLKVFRRYYIHKANNVLCEVTVTLTFDPWPADSIQVILESKWMCAPDVRKFSFGIADILSWKQRKAMWPFDHQNVLNLEFWISNLCWKYGYSVDVFSFTQHLLHFCRSWERDPSQVALSEVSMFFGVVFPDRRQRMSHLVIIKTVICEYGLYKYNSIDWFWLSMLTKMFRILIVMSYLSCCSSFIY